MVRQATLGDVPVNDYLNLADPSNYLQSMFDAAPMAQRNIHAIKPQISLTGTSREDAGRSIDQLLRNCRREQMQSPTAKAYFHRESFYLHVPEAEKARLALIALPPADGKALGFWRSHGKQATIPFSAMRTQLRASYGFRRSIMTEHAASYCRRD